MVSFTFALLINYIDFKTKHGHHYIATEHKHDIHFLPIQKYSVIQLESDGPGENKASLHQSVRKLEPSKCFFAMFIFSVQIPFKLSFNKEPL